jgi:hypothetical protein
MKSTEAIPGKPIVMKLREDEEPQIMDWLNLQGMYSDSIRYLIQKEIAENGLRNLQLYVPQARTIDSIKLQMSSLPINQLNHNAVEASSNISISPSYQTAVERDPTTSQNAQHLSPTNSSFRQPYNNVKVDDFESSDSSFVSEGKNNLENSENTVSNVASEKEHIDKAVSTNTVKRKAAKQFGSDVADSYAN